MAVNAYALTSLVNVKAALHITTTDDDTLLENLINRISAAVESYCRRKFKARDYTEKYDGDGTSVLYLKQYPVNSVSSLKIGTGTVNSSDYVLYKEEGKIRLKYSVFPEGIQNVEVAYNAGYQDGSSELDALEQIVINEIQAHYLAGQTDIVSPEGEGEIPDKKVFLTEEARRWLQPFVRRDVYGC